MEKTGSRPLLDSMGPGVTAPQQPEGEVT